jgi:energy-coupling factor transporter ATP-binding protein EcfA2
MITFDHITYTYPGATQPALHDINLHVSAGEFVLLVGASGAGKSTLLRCINGLVPHFSGGILAGNLRVNKLDPVQATPQVMSRHVGFVFQDPEAQFVMDRVEDELAFALENAALPAQEMRMRVEETLDLLDLTPLRDRPLETLSGGERQRVAIAAALALRPQILILDEPTSQLDPKSAEDVLNALVRLNSDLGLTIVLAEHRLERVLPFVDRIVYLPADGSALLVDTPRAVLQQIAVGPPLVMLGKLLHWEPLPLTIKEGLLFSRQLLEHSRPSPVVRRQLAHTGEPLIQVRKLEVAYGRHAILNGINLDIWSGEIVALLGRNGAGKTTLLKSLVGLVRPQRGSIRVAGRDIAKLNVDEICRTVGYLPQDPNALLFADTVREELLITLRNHGFYPKRKGALPIDPDGLLAYLQLSGKAAAYPRDLSVGERQRVALAAVTVTKPTVLLLDEPTRGLDYATKAQLTTLLQAWRKDGMAILLITHDVELVALLADRVVLMSQGEIIAEGMPGEVLGASPLFAPQVARLFPGTHWLTVADVLASASSPRIA